MNVSLEKQVLLVDEGFLVIHGFTQPTGTLQFLLSNSHYSKLITDNPEPFNFKKLSGFTPFFRCSGAVRNADRIWVSTPQNRTYRAWGEN